ncbi:MAG: VWA domain-containing protein [Deltaproteobacteria bacterium]|nr:VWA domain-containing protein [Deltaproteobacteria bacterium]
MRWLAAACACLWACTDAGLERIPPRERLRDDKLALSGELCTLSPRTLAFPVRILFVVDASESMRVTDPPDPVTGETARERAVRESWTRLLAEGADDVRVGILRFSAEAQSRTVVDTDGDGIPESYFTASEPTLDAATQALGSTDRTTNYVNALSEAHYELRTELLAASQESLPLSKYVVVFLSDGLPDVDDSQAGEASLANVRDAVRSLRDLAELFHVGDFAFHTAYLSAGQGPSQDLAAQSLLEEMATLGGGTFRSFPSGEELNFLFVDFSVVRRVFTLRSLVAVNTQAVVDSAQLTALDLGITPAVPGVGTDLDGDGQLGCGEPLTDTDGDGLADIVELYAGTDLFERDTDDDGLGDRIEWDLGRIAGQGTAGLDPLDPTDSGCFVPSLCTDEDEDGACDCVADSDGDGVCDCVTDPDAACADDLGHDCLDLDLDERCDCPDLDLDGRCDWSDKDGDGLRDCEEVFYGTSQNGVDSDADGLPDAVEVRFRTSAVESDGAQDIDFDDTLNATEVQSASDPLCADLPLRPRGAYRYAVDTLGLVGDRTCYTFAIDNVTLMATRPNPSAASPGNGINRVLVYAGEVSFDDAQSYARYRVACVEARWDPAGAFKDPPSGRMRLVEEDFVDIGEFDPDLHCKRP